ncbi:MAG: DegT/DnrJ/EryC1/StrS family aminotransferase [Pyrinomonadaceae bacterium]
MPTEATKQMSVPLLDLKTQHDALHVELHAAVERVMSSQQFILGSEVKELEAEIARYSTTKYAVGCASGSDALLLALMALDVKAGDEIITTPYSFFATAGSVARPGAIPVFVDIEPDTFNINPALIEQAITPHTKAIMPVHLFGQCAAMDDINAIAARAYLPVIEDAAQAIGAEDAGRRAGALSAMGCFSFYPTKNLGGAGDGGMLTTNDEKLAERLRVLRVHGGATEYHHTEVGINSRLDSLQAAVLRVKLPHLDAWSDARAEHACQYARLFAEAELLDDVTLPVVRKNVRHIFNQYVIRVDASRRDALIEHLKRHNIGVKIYYPVSLHQQECFGYLNYAEGSLPEAERAARETLAIPCYPELTFAQQEYVVDVIRRFFRS